MSAPPDAGAVLLTGVGGIIGESIIKCLAHTSWRVIGVDASELAAGLYAVPKGYVVPKSNDPAYVDRLLDICAAERVRYLFNGLDLELPIIAAAADRFRQAGIIPIVSPPSVIAIGDDKLETVRFLESHRFPAPRTADYCDPEAADIGFPLVLKPRRGGSRSQGYYFVENRHEMRLREALIDPANCLVQEYIEGDEYSVGSISFDGACFGAMAMRRTLRDGNSHKAHVVHIPAIEAFVRKAAEELKPFGPCNFQLRMRRGVPYIFDINPRCSGGSYIRALAGFNEPLMALEYLEHGVRPRFECRPLTVFRYWNEVVVEPGQVAEARRSGIVKNEHSGL
jgi:carbamoyl-phosphate synthase large subunit